MKFADLLSRLFAFLPRAASLDAVLDNTLWLIGGCSTAFGLALTTALFAARQHLASAELCRSENESQQLPLNPPSNGNT